MKSLNRSFNSFIIAIIFLFAVNSTVSAQILGGIGDGYASNRYLGSLNGGAIEILYQGGADDGFAQFRRIGAWRNQNISESFAGGIGDGYASGGFIGGLNGTSIAALFQAGSGDGFDQTAGKGFIRQSIVLPVELISFQTVAQQGQVLLKWETETELNNDFFTVERSADAVNFEALLVVSGSGTSFEKHQYEAVDPRPLAGTSYYRLKSTDFDGTTYFSQIVAVYFGAPPGIFNMEVYANPNVGRELQIKLQLPQNVNRIRFELMDMLGRTVFSQTSVGKEAVTKVLNLPDHLAKGMYLLRAGWENTQISKLVIIQ